MTRYDFRLNHREHTRIGLVVLTRPNEVKHCVSRITSPLLHEPQFAESARGSLSHGAGLPRTNADEFEHTIASAG
jgi:hypothetical protein